MMTGAVVSCGGVITAVLVQLDPITAPGKQIPYWLQRQVAWHINSGVAQEGATTTVRLAVATLPELSLAVYVT